MIQAMSINNLTKKILVDPLVSVIIPTKNSSSTLARCLDSIMNQTYKNIEIIVVDNYSSDTTLDIANRYTNNIFTIGPERGAQINYGANHASGKYLYRVDSDFELDANIILEAVSTAELNNYAAILIHNTSDPIVSYWAKVRKFERDMYASDDLNVAVRFILREVFSSVGGFDPQLVSGEDYDLHNRIIQKYDIGRICPKETHLREYKSIKEVVEKHYHYGKSINLFLKKNRSRGFKQLSPFRKAYLKHYREFLTHPCLTIGFIVYQVVRYGACAIGIFISKLRTLI